MQKRYLVVFSLLIVSMFIISGCNSSVGTKISAKVGCSDTDGGKDYFKK